MLIEAEDAHFAALIASASGGPSVIGTFTIAEGGLESPEILGMLRGVAQKVCAHFSPAAWLVVEENEIVGLVSVAKVPGPDGVVEIGYGIAASRRCRGFAGKAIGDVLAWARSDPRVQAVSAETSVANLPSQLVLGRNGFTRTGERHDAEDGDLFCWMASTVNE